MGKCNQCGMCCRAIHLNYTKKAVAQTWEDASGNRKFILKNWKRISKEQAIKNNPNVGSMVPSNGCWYTCRLLEGNHCSIQESKPPICAGYPWYGGEPFQSELYGKDCGFKVDMEVKK
jgi:Fe-S-cluster containining protein